MIENAAFASHVDTASARETPTTVTRRVMTTQNVASPPSSSLLLDEASAPSWLRSAFLQILDWARESEPADLPQFARCIAFLSSLSHSTPEPFLAIGDDGSIGVEWDRRGNHLHLTFSGNGDEAYWLGKDGSEREVPSIEELGSELNDLIRMISSY